MKKEIDIILADLKEIIFNRIDSGMEREEPALEILTAFLMMMKNYSFMNGYDKGIEDATKEDIDLEKEGNTLDARELAFERFMKEYEHIWNQQCTAVCRIGEADFSGWTEQNFAEANIQKMVENDIALLIKGECEHGH